MYVQQAPRENWSKKLQVLILTGFLSGSQGGGQQIASRIACNEIDLLIFFRDPLNPKPHEPNDNDLLRLCDVHNIPFATNIATAEALIRGVERGDFEWREIVNPRYNKPSKI